MKKKNQQSAIQRRPWYRNISWLYAVGSVLIFLSWVSENYVQKQWQNERERLDRLRQKLIANDILANVWLSSLMNQQSLPSSKTATKASMALQYINFSHHVRAAALEWTNSDSQEHQAILNLSRQILFDAADSMQNEQYAGVLELANASRRLEEGGSVELVPDNEKLYDEIEAKESFWGIAFVLLYCIGAFMIAGAYLKNQAAKVELT